MPADHPGAEAYEGFIGRWSRMVAREFLGWLSLPPHLRWLDVGCGTGALTAAILESSRPQRACGVDLSGEYVSFVRKSFPARRCGFAVADAGALPFGGARFDVAVSGLTLNLVPAPRAAVAEMARVIEPGGVVAAYVWDFAAGMQLFRFFWDVATELNPRAAGLDQANVFSWCTPEGLRTLFEGAALEGVGVRAIQVPLEFARFEDYWTPLLSGHGRLPGYVMSLDASERAALREGLRVRLPTRPDGSIHLAARAWAVRGSPP